MLLSTIHHPRVSFIRHALPFPLYFEVLVVSDGKAKPRHLQNMFSFKQTSPSVPHASRPLGPHRIARPFYFVPPARPLMQLLLYWCLPLAFQLF